MTFDDMDYESLMEPDSPFFELEHCCDNQENRRKALERKYRDKITNFLGDGPRSVEVYKTKPYYHELLAWSLKSITANPGWEILSSHCYFFPEPTFQEVQTDYSNKETCLIDGLMLVEKDGIRLVITISIMQGGSVQIEASAEYNELVKRLIQEVAEYVKDNNFYRGKRLMFEGQISFLKAEKRDWESVILDRAMKKDIRRHSLGFLKDCAKYEKLGMSTKRGLILAGEPGVGKTAICKALMTEAEGITCIVTNPYSMQYENYITNLYSVAQDLNPSLVFIEDIDVIGQARGGFFRGTPPLMALLAAMDGIAVNTFIVTIATSNCYEVLDKALKERPSRFDRVFKIDYPTGDLRVELVKLLTEKIPLSQEVREFIVNKTDGFSPAQIQEILCGMVISNPGMEEATLQFTKEDANAAIASLNMGKNGMIGFNTVPYRYPNASTEKNLRKE